MLAYRSSAPTLCLDAGGHACGLELHPPGSSRRGAVEALINSVYRRRYDAQPPDFAPMLVSLSGSQGPVAAAGYRSAAQGPLFLERYLDRPIEQLLCATGGGTASRAVIVEVGHLAATRVGEGKRLVHCLGQHLMEEGYAWVVSTVTRELRKLFLRLGVTPLALGAADPRALGDERFCWGRYYDHEPVILAGYLPQAMGRLGARHCVAPGERRRRFESVS
jgi:hypothetical protein